MTPRITAAVCTHNRADDLMTAIASLARQSLAEGTFEIIVVDNASTDHTADVICAAQGGAVEVRNVTNISSACRRRGIGRLPRPQRP